MIACAINRDIEILDFKLFFTVFAVSWWRVTHPASVHVHTHFCSKVLILFDVVMDLCPHSGFWATPRKVHRKVNQTDTEGIITLSCLLFMRAVKGLWAQLDLQNRRAKLMKCGAVANFILTGDILIEETGSSWWRRIPQGSPRSKFTCCTVLIIPSELTCYREVFFSPYLSCIY